MRFWFAILSAVMLILSFSAGDAAIAATVRCDPNTIEVIDHDQAPDETSDCPLSGTPHHHHACSGHHAAAQASDAAVELAFLRAPAGLAAAFPLLSGRSPPSELRPPIA